jgi:putative copper resistance protein D
VRIPRLALLAWVVAAATVIGVGFAVWHYLSQTGGHAGHGMSMPGMTSGDALVRGGGRTNPLQPLFGTALLTAWQLDALAVVLVVLLGAWYLTGVALVPVRSPGERWPIGRTISFFAGLLMIVIATCGSVAVYDQVLFTAHMAGHLLLVMAAPALLVAGRPLRLSMAASGPSTRARLERLAQGRVIALLTAPPVALATYTAVIVGTHLTGLMDTIMRHTWAGQLEHLVFLLVGYQFFVLVVGEEPIRWRLAAPARWLLLAIAMAVDTFTGVVLLQGTHSVALAPSRLDVNALSDTRTGGAIMWAAGDGIMAIVMISLVVAWLRTAETSGEDATGWLEQARRAHFTEQTGVETDTSLDRNEQARESYNAYLQRLNRR